MRWFLLLILVFSLAACSDDDDSTDCGCPVDNWEEADLPAELVDGFVLDLSAGSGRLLGLAVGSSGSWVVEREGADWNLVADAPIPGTAPPLRAAAEPSGAVGGVTADGQGNVIVVGGDTGSLRAMLWWYRPENGWQSSLPVMLGFLQDVVPFGEEGFVATGSSSPGFLQAGGQIYGGYSMGRREVSGSGEAGLTSLAAASDNVFGIGFDDGAEGTADEPWRIVMHHEGQGVWSRVESPCGGCGSYDFRAVEVSPDALYVGGSVWARPQGDPSAPGQEYAWLAIRSFQESEWTTIVLPEPERLQRVNAILAASNGTVWLACGGFDDTAYLVRAEPGESPVIDLEDEALRIFELVEAEDGTILASGMVAGSSFGTPVILERRN